MTLNNHMQLRNVALFTFMIVAAGSRLIPHPPNFTALPAMALLSAALMGRKWIALAAPFIAMAVSDALLYAFVYELAAPAKVAPKYLATACTVWIGLRLTRSAR